MGPRQGRIEADESAEQAAVREVREETGIDAEIEASLGETRYFYVWEDVRVREVVHFFLMRATGATRPTGTTRWRTCSGSRWIER